MWNNFFKHIDIDPNNAHILDGNAPDLQAECDAFEKKIEEAGGIDLFVGGMRNCSVVSYGSNKYIDSFFRHDLQNIAKTTSYCSVRKFCD